MIAIQIIISIFALFMMYVVFVQRKMATITSFEQGVWNGLWIVFIFLTFFPSVLDGITHRIFFSRVFDLLVLVAFMILTTLVIDLRFKVLKLNKKIEDYVRENAIIKSK